MKTVHTVSVSFGRTPGAVLAAFETRAAAGEAQVMLIKKTERLAARLDWAKLHLRQPVYSLGELRVYESLADLKTQL